MIFQSKYKGNHTIVMSSATYEQIPGLQRAKLVPQVVATFGGPQRLFDSEKAKKENAWTQETHDAMVDWLFNHPRYMLDFFPAPRQEVPEEYANIRKPEQGPRICEQFEFVDNDIIRCPEPVTAGRNYCADHDPDKQVIRKGIGTTVG